MQKPDQSISNLVSRISYDSQDPQWKKLELKYKECIKLLKKKIVQLEAKENTVTKASLSVSSWEPVVVVGMKMERVVERRVREVWGRIRVVAEWGKEREREREERLRQERIREERGKENEEERKRKESQLQGREKGSNKNNCIYSGLRILSNIISLKNQQTLTTLLHPNSQYSSLSRLSSILSSKLTSLKSTSFISLKLHKSTPSQKISQLLHIQSLLSSLNSSFDSSSSPHYNHKKQNSLLLSQLSTSTTLTNTLQATLSTTHSHNLSELNKKQNTISQLIEEISQKDRIISEYELEIETYRGLKGKGKCGGYECMIEKRKLGGYYEGALKEGRGKDERIGELERRCERLGKELEEERREREREAGELRRVVEEGRREKMERVYREEVERRKIGWANERMRIAGEKDAWGLELEEEITRIKGVFFKVLQLTNTEVNQQQTPSILYEINKLLLSQSHSKQPSPPLSPVTPTQILTLIQKLLSQPQLNLSDYPILPKPDQQRLQLIQTTILQMKQSLSQPPPPFSTSQPQTDHQFLIVKPLNQRTNDNNLLNRVIDLESDGKKNEEMILGLKKKFMEARQTVLMCLNLLAVKSISKEGEMKLEELFDLFEYTDEEREIVLLASRGAGKGRFFNKWF